MPCCSGLCYDKLAGGAAGVMLTSSLICILWYLAMAKCATMVGEKPDGTYGYRIRRSGLSVVLIRYALRTHAIPVGMVFLTAFWVTRRCCDILLPVLTGRVGAGVPPALLWTGGRSIPRDCHYHGDDLGIIYRECDYVVGDYGV